MGIKVKLNNVRVNFPVLFTPKKFRGDDTSKPAFSAGFLIPKKSPLVKAINDAIQAAAVEKWGDKAAAQVKAARAKDNVFFRDGDLKSEKYPEAEGHMLVGARGYTRPTVLAADKSPLTEADGKIYSGCFVNASVEVWAQNFNGVPRINCALKGVQFAKDGDAFSGGAPASADEFDDVSNTGDEENLAD